MKQEKSIGELIGTLCGVLVAMALQAYFCLVFFNTVFHEANLPEFTYWFYFCGVGTYRALIPGKLKRSVNEWR